MEQMVPNSGTLVLYPGPLARWSLSLAAAVALCLLAACSTTSLDETGRAPVTDRSPRTGSSAAAVTPPPGQENAGKPGYYSVRPGDTLTRIGLEQGQSARDLARWNALDNPNLIEVGQVLRVVPPAKEPVAASPGVMVTPVPMPAADARIKPRNLNDKPITGPVDSEELAFSWPVSGALLERFDEIRNKGVDLAGKAGDPVLAAADGRVVYAGAGLRGYGNLVILKHNNTYLTAYAHNQALMVKEDQTVRQGQKIAEMGSTDADRVKLHFELRRQGKPIDPLKFLPSR